MKSPIEIILKDEIQKIFDAFSACLNVRIAFFSPEGKELMVGLERPCNEFCTIIREAMHKKNKCLFLDTEKRKEALSLKGLYTWSCYAGMIETIFPIFYNGVHLGFFLMGQYRGQRKIDQALLQEYKELCGSPEELVIAYLKTPSFTDEEIRNMQHFFRLIVDYIISQNMITLKSNFVVEKILTEIKQHPEESLTLEDASRLVGKSMSSISHIFSDLLHTSFKQTLIEIKMEKAEEYMMSDPNLSIREIAFKLGYEDPYYFSRLYKKHRKVPPSKFRTELLNNKASPAR
jgi:AraC-like DNA-binding protein